MIDVRELHDVTEMSCVFQMEKSVKEMHERVFKGRDLSVEDILLLHRVCTSQLRKEKRSMAIRVELFVLLYLCEPQSLFYSTKQYSQTVRDYAGHVIGIQDWRFSKYKQNLVFLYFNDKVFRGAVNGIIAAVKEPPEKKNGRKRRRKSTSQWKNRNSD